MTNAAAAPFIYMLDTNVFNRVLDGRLSLGCFAGKHLMVTGVQADELRACGSQERRDALLLLLAQLTPVAAVASSFLLDIEGAGLDQAEWNDGTGRFEKMLIRLRELDNKDRSENQLRDIVIAETAIKSGAILVTDDAKLSRVTTEFGGQGVDCQIFKSRQGAKA